MAEHVPHWSLARRAGTAALVAGLGVIVLFALAHAPWVEDAIGRWAVARLQRAGILLRVERLRYNLLTLHLRAEGVSLAAGASPQEPFVQARAIDLTLPWSALEGRLSIDSIQLDGARVTLVRRKDGSTNWPSSTAGPSSPPRSFPIRRAVARDLAIAWRDETLESRADVDGASLDLEPGPQGAAGRLLVARPVRFAWRGREDAIGAQADLSWNGTRLTIASARLESSEIALQAGGSVDLRVASPQIALDYDGRVDLAAATGWVSIDPRPSGAITFRGRASGPLSSPRAEVTLAGSGLAWSGLTGVSIDAGLRVDGHGIDVDRLDARVGGGSVRAQGRLALDENAPNRVTLDWRGVDAEGLLATFGARARVGVATEVDGRAAASWTAWRADAVTASADARVRPAGVGPRRLGLGGRLTLGAEDGEWRAAIDQRIDDAVHVEGAIGGRISGGALSRSTLTGRATATADAPDRLWRLLRKLDLASGGPPRDLAGHARADFVLAGTLADPSADVRFAIADARRGPIGPIAVDSHISLSTHEASVADLEARLGANTLRASGSVSFDSDRLSGSVEASLPALDEVLLDVPSSLRPAGTLELSATISGRTSSPIVDGRLGGRTLGFAGQQADRLVAIFHLTRHAASVEHLELTQPDGSVEATGTYTLSTGSFTSTVSAKNVALTPIVGADGATPTPVRARIDGGFAASGTVGDPHGQGRVELRDVQWADRHLGTVAGDLTLSDHRLRSVLRLPDLFVTATASLALNPFGAFIVDAQVTEADLAALASRLAPSTRAPITGTTSFAAHVDGQLDRLSQSHATLDLQRFDASVGDVPVRVIRAGRVSYDERGVDAGDFVLDIGRCELRVAGRLDHGSVGTLSASLDGTLADVAQVAMGIGRADRQVAGLELDGRVSLEARVTGPIDRPEVDATARLDDGRLSVSGFPPATAVTLRASYAAGLVELSQLNASWQGATVTATSRTPLALFAQQLPDWLTRTLPRGANEGRLSARFEALTPGMLAPWVPVATLSQLGGVLSGTLTLDADAPTLAGLRGELVLDRAELSVAGVKLDEQRPTRLAMAGGQVRVVDWEWGAEGNRISIGGSVRLEAPRALDLSATGQVDLRLLGAFLPSVRTTGRAVMSARITGTTDAPLVDGRIDLQGGALRLASPQLIVSDLEGAMLLTRDELTVADVHGSANGGSLHVAGRFRYPGFQPTDGRLTITGRGIAMALPPPLKTRVDADVSLGFDRGSLSLGGDVTVFGGSYREPLSLAGGLLQSLQSTPVMQVESSSLVDAMTLDVRITTAEDIQVDNNYAQLAVGAGLRLRGTVAQPVLAGRAEAREGGQIFLGGNVYQLVGSGIIDFANPSRIEPDFNITAMTRIGPDDVTLTLKGPLSRLQTILTASDPRLSQGEIVSLLVTGRVQVEGGSGPVVGRDRLVAYLSGEFLGVAGRAVGLDVLRIEPGGNVRFDAGLIAGETDPGSRLTFGKQVTLNVELVFSQNLRDSGKFTWIAAYRPRSNVELRLVSQENNDRIYDFRHNLTIGGSPAAASTSPPAAAPRVGAIQFTGELGRIEPELRRHLSLTSDKRFDFFRWQRDRDKLERFIEESGYVEAHVVARRIDAAGGAAGTIDLEYEVHPGPRTIVDVSGAVRVSAIRKEVEAVWTRSVFDAFLVDEAVKAARTVLIRDGYLRAAVAASIDVRSGGGEKHLALAISSGPRSDRRQLAFSGNQHVPTDRLSALVRAQALERTAWLDPAPLERAVAALYRDEGFLAASVKAGEPVFEGRAATLPVTIDEGRVSSIERVDFAGVKSQPIGDVRAGFGIQPGMVLTRAAVEQAVEALSERYRKLGFSSVNVTLTGSEREAGAVALTVAVDEGPRQILREVAIEGVRRTSPALVSRELRLNLGEPVDPSAWTLARRRLYDMGVFRDVDLEAVPVEPEAGQAGAEQPVRARVTLEEWPPLRLRYGFEVDDAQQPASESRTLRPGLAADLTYRNIFGRAATSGVAARYTNGFRAVRGFVTMPGFFGLPLTSNLFLARSREQIGTTERPAVADKTDFTAEQRFRLRGRLQIAYSYNFERNHTFDVNANPDDPSAFDITINIARLTATGIFDSRDDLVDATRGMLFSSTFEYGASALGSDLRFAKQFVEQTYYRRIGRGLVFATAGRLGLAAGYGQDLIPSERFFAGGGNSVRGYLENSLGSRDLFGTTGGNALLVLNEEVRFPIVWRLRGVAFIDAGNVFARVGDLALSDLRVGTGFGLRVQTPFALLRVDVGAPLHRAEGDSPVRLFFSIGQVF